MPQNVIGRAGADDIVAARLTDWVRDERAVSSILGAVDQMDLSASTGRTGTTVRVEAAYGRDDEVVALLLYACAFGPTATATSTAATSASASLPT